MVPLPNLHNLFWFYQFTSSLPPRTSLKSLHLHDSCLGLPLTSKLLQNPYLEYIIFFHKLCSFVYNLHFHLVNNVILNTLMSLRPKSPPSFDLQIVSHFTQAIFLPSLSQS